MQRSNHDGIRLFSDAPIRMTIMSGGEPLHILCRRDLHQAILDIGLLTYRVPQNAAMPKVVQRAIVETTAEKVEA